MSDNIHVKYCDSGIIKVIVNTHKRWCEYSIFQRYDNTYTVEEMDEHGFLSFMYGFSVKLTPNTRYTRIDDQEKDQVYVYFIPTDMI